MSSSHQGSSETVVIRLSSLDLESIKNGTWADCRHHKNVLERPPLW